MAEMALEISNVLGFLLKNHEISEAELARKINVPRATINRLVSGKTPDPRASTLNAIAEYFNVSVDQLIGKEPLFLDSNQIVISNKNKSIPIINWEETKNWETALDEIKPDGHFNWIMIDSSIDEGKFAIQVNGESMWPQFQMNSILIIDPTKEPKNRDFVIVYIKKSDEILFRQLIVENKHRFLKSINSIFPSLEITACDKIIGVVIQTRNNF